MAKVTQLRVNGAMHSLDADEDRSLLSVLREDLGLTGSKFGCGEGQCGACTVLLDGKMTRSCITPVSVAEGKSVATIEGVAQGGKLHPLQQAFLETEAMQCGYCTSGMIVSGVALLRQNPDPTDDEINRFMGGNLCRCGTYGRIRKAIHQAAAQMKGGTK
jgi:aerobic-type carbon monoxide dehydrogenase small subunit (CoxS/CutS family)